MNPEYLQIAEKILPGLGMLAFALVVWFGIKFLVEGGGTYHHL